MIKVSESMTLILWTATGEWRLCQHIYGDGWTSGGLGIVNPVTMKRRGLTLAWIFSLSLILLDRSYDSTQAGGEGYGCSSAAARDPERPALRWGRWQQQRQICLVPTLRHSSKGAPPLLYPRRQEKEGTKKVPKGEVPGQAYGGPAERRELGFHIVAAPRQVIPHRFSWEIH